MSGTSIRLKGLSRRESRRRGARCVPPRARPPGPRARKALEEGWPRRRVARFRSGFFFVQFAESYPAAGGRGLGRGRVAPRTSPKNKNCFERPYNLRKRIKRPAGAAGRGRAAPRTIPLKKTELSKKYSPCSPERTSLKNICTKCGYVGNII